MSIHKWKKHRTRHFGEVWVPLAQVEVQGADRRFRTIALQIDSGAVVSLLRRSSAKLLKLPLESGRQIELSSVGGATTVAYVHELRVRFAPHEEFVAPFAIAAIESVPNLLGRIGIFDRILAQFDGPKRETRITWYDGENTTFPRS